MRQNPWMSVAVGRSWAWNRGLWALAGKGGSCLLNWCWETGAGSPREKAKLGSYSSNLPGPLLRVASEHQPQGGRSVQPAGPGSGCPEEPARVSPTLQPVSPAGPRERVCEGVWGPGCGVTLSLLPAPRRLTCDDCLANSSQCAWCQSTHTCFMFAAYLARYPHGGCRGWDDRCGPGGRVPGGEGGDQGRGGSDSPTPITLQRALRATVPEL